MSKLLIILALFAFIELYIQGRSHRIPLKRGSSPRKNAKPLGFLEESPTLERIDLNYPYFARANIGDMTDNLLAISLFNSFLFLSNCPDTFKYFNCSAEPSSCFYPVHKKRDGFDFPYYSLEGTYVMVNMSLGTFGRGERIMTLYADKCSKNSYNNNEVMGAVGLSLRDNNYENFDTVDNKFSIWLERDGSDGELIFGEDSSCEADEPYINLVGVTLDWELRLAQINFMESKYDYLQGMAIFDINSNFIGIPEHIHWHLMRDLKQRHNFVCAKEMLTPNCTFSGDINSLPDLTLSMADGGSVITIPPAVYTRKLPEENLYTCLLVSLEKDPVDAHQLPVTECYRNYIVLGSPFMQYYYTVFNYENVDEPQIRLYVPKENSDI